MTTAIFGLLGVIVGGAITSLTQFWTERRAARLRARVAARILAMELLSAATRLQVWSRHGRKPPSFQANALRQAWDETKDSLVDLSWDEWVSVHSAVMYVLTFAAYDGDVGLGPDDAEQVVTDIQNAINKLLPHGSELPRRRWNLQGLSAPWSAA